MNNTINIKSRDLPVFSIVITVWHKRREFSILIDSVESVLPRRNATCKLFVWMRTQKKIPRTKSTGFTYVRLEKALFVGVFKSSTFLDTETQIFFAGSKQVTLCFVVVEISVFLFVLRQDKNKKIWLLLLSFCHCRFYWSRLIFW